MKRLPRLDQDLGPLLTALAAARSGTDLQARTPKPLEPPEALDSQPLSPKPTNPKRLNPKNPNPNFLVVPVGSSSGVEDRTRFFIAKCSRFQDLKIACSL